MKKNSPLLPLLILALLLLTVSVIRISMIAQKFSPPESPITATTPSPVSEPIAQTEPETMPEPAVSAEPEATPLPEADPDRYPSSGSSELDDLIFPVIDGFLDQEPDADRERLLRLSYDYLLSGISCGKGPVCTEDTPDLLLSEAVRVLRTGSGGSGGVSSVFRAFALALGYESPSVRSRYMETEGSIDCWCEIVLDGMTEIFDPFRELQTGTACFRLDSRSPEASRYRGPASPLSRTYEAYEDMTYTEPTECGTVEDFWIDNRYLFLIYLPYGYDPSRLYNVLVYQNGADGDPYKMLGEEYEYSHGNAVLGTALTTRSWLDYLIQYGYCDPLIVVSTTTSLGPRMAENVMELIRFTAEHYSTYAESASDEDLIRARDHFAIAGPSTASQSICVAVQELPDMFSYFGLFSGMYDYDPAMQAFAEKRSIHYMLLSAGQTDYMLPYMQEAYADLSRLPNIEVCELFVPSGCDHDWVTFDGAIRQFLFRFCPSTET